MLQNIVQEHEEMIFKQDNNIDTLNKDNDRLEKEKKELLDDIKSIQTNYKKLETNHEKIKKTKAEMAKLHKKEISLIKQQHEDLLRTAQGGKQSTKSRTNRIEELTNQKLINSIIEVKNAIRNMKINKSRDSFTILEKIRIIDKMRKELQSKTKKIADLESVISSLKYKAQKHDADAQAKTQEFQYKTATTRRKKSQEEYDRRHKHNDQDHFQRRKQKEKSLKLKVSEKSTVLENCAHDTHQFGKKIGEKNDMHIQTGKFDNVDSTIDSSMHLLSETLATNCVRGAKDIVEKYARKIALKRKERGESNGHTAKGQHTFTQYAYNDSPNVADGIPVFRTLQEARDELIPGWEISFDDETKTYFFVHVATNTKCYHSPHLFESAAEENIGKEIDFDDEVECLKTSTEQTGSFKTTGLYSDDDDEENTASSSLGDNRKAIPAVSPAKELDGQSSKNLLHGSDNDDDSTIIDSDDDEINNNQGQTTQAIQNMEVVEEIRCLGKRKLIDEEENEENRNKYDNSSTL